MNKSNRFVFYISVAIFIIGFTFFLLVTGNHYNKNKGFYPNETGPLDTVTAIQEVPENVFWPLVVLVSIAVFIELAFLIFSRE